VTMGVVSTPMPPICSGQPVIGNRCH